MGNNFESVPFREKEIYITEQKKQRDHGGIGRRSSEKFGQSGRNKGKFKV